MDNGGHSEREGEVMTQVLGGRGELSDNVPTIEPLTAQTGNINVTSAFSRNLHLQKGDAEEQEVFQKTLFGNTGRSRDTEEEKKGNAEEHRDCEEEDLDKVMKEEDEEEEDASEGLSSLNRCQSPDPTMTDSFHSKRTSLLETQCPFSPGTSPELFSPIMPMATPETLYPISQVSQCESVVRVKPFTSNNVSVGSVTVGQSLPPWIEDPATLTPATQPIREFFTSSPVAFNVMANTTDLSSSVGCTLATEAAGPSLCLRLGSTSAWTQCASSKETLSSNREPTLSSSGPASISGPMCDTRHVPGQDLLKSLEDLAQRGDDAYLPQYLHKMAEGFVLKENYQWALWCIQLERLYHQRLLDNLNVLQEQWESQIKFTSSELETRHLDSLKHICQTHSRPSVKDAVCVSRDIVRSTAEGGGELSPRVSDGHVDGRMETRDKESSHFESDPPVLPSCKITDVESPGIAEKREDPERKLVGGEGFHRSQLTERGEIKATEVEKCTISALRDELPPFTSVALEQPGPAEQQGGNLCLTKGRLPKQEAEESFEEKTVNTLKMNVEAEAEEEEKVRQRVLQVVSRTDVAQLQLYQEALAEKTQLQESYQSFVYQMVSLPSDDHIKQKDHGEVEDADIREASMLDDLAKVITVEEISPACGLVSILKRQNETVGGARMNFRSSKASSKRCVRFKLPDDSYEHDVGGGDSCLLLFLLCLVTVVISLSGTALYCALGDIHSSICQDFTRNADFYMDQIQHGISHIQNWFGPGS